VSAELAITPRLDALEAVIERGLGAFVEVGRALLEIRDSRLYRETHGTFEDYCRERWDFDRTYAHRLTQAATVVSMLPIGNTPSPANEAVVRELAPLRDEPEALRETWDAAVQEHGEQPTAAQVRDVVRGGMAVHYSSDTDEWSTPQALFDELHAEFDFGLDVCATASVAKCPTFFSPEQDGLAQDWSGTCWMNPPYGATIGRWVEKAWESAKAGATVVCLVPARVDTGWWWDHCRFGEVRFLRGRLRFGDALTGAPFPSAVVIFGRPPAVRWWER